MKQRLARLRQIARRLRDVFPPTARGCALLGVSALALWWYGLVALDLVVLVLGLAGILLALLSALGVAASALYLRRHLPATGPGPLALEARHLSLTGFRVPGLGLIPFISMRWEWSQPAGVGVRPLFEDGFHEEMIVSPRRCQAAGVTRRFSVQDVFGLSRVAWQVQDPAPITILPDPGALRTTPVVQSMSGGDNMPHPFGRPEGDRMDIRAYMPGDSVRNILWKTYARTRQLNVRMPERAVAQARRTVGYLATGPSDEPAAAAARVALDTGALGLDWAFGADGSPHPTDDLGEAHRAIALSGMGPHPPGITSFLEEVLREGQAHCIVFAPSRPGPWLAAVLAAARAHPAMLSFVVGTDGVSRSGPVALWERLLLDHQDSPATPASELAVVLHQLQATGASVLLVDRLQGRAYGAAHQQALEALAR